MVTLSFLLIGILAACAREPAAPPIAMPPSISGVRGMRTVNTGVLFDALEGVSAYDSENKDLTGSIALICDPAIAFDDGKYVFSDSEAGIYELAYSVTDRNGNKKSAYTTLSVQKVPDYGYFLGAGDKDKTPAQAFQSLVYKDSATGVSMTYALYVPSDYDANREYPMMVFLHGNGSQGTNLPFINGGVGYELFLRYISLSDKYSCIFVAPQCPSGDFWTPYADYSNGYTNVDATPRTAASRAMTSLLDTITETYSIDHGRQYITGLSMGGFGTWDLLARFPGRFAAAAPICGGGDASYAELIKATAVWAFHGNADERVPVSGSRNMVAALEAAGADIKYTEYPGVGHECWNHAFAEDEYFSFLFTKAINQS
jgi:predicted peptidase